MRAFNMMPSVYIVASQPRGTLYIGVTAKLVRRVGEHKCGFIAGFTRRYKIHRLVWFEQYDVIDDAIYREKMLKAWKRSWKLELIEMSNPAWDDLYEQII